MTLGEIEQGRAGVELWLPKLWKLGILFVFSPWNDGFGASVECKYSEFQHTLLIFLNSINLPVFR